MKNRNWRQYPPGSASRVLAHGITRRLRGQNPSMSFGVIRNPRVALEVALRVVMARKVSTSLSEEDIYQRVSVSGREYRLCHDYRQVRQGVRVALVPTNNFNSPLDVQINASLEGFWGLADEADIPPSVLFEGTLAKAPFSQIGIDTSDLQGAEVAGVIYPRGTTYLFYAGSDERQDILFALSSPFGIE